MKKSTDIELMKNQFKMAKSLVGQKVAKINFYLESSDIEMTEQPNSFGKSLLNGIDIETQSNIFSIGNRYTNLGYGLSIAKGKTNEIENFQEVKNAVEFQTSIKGQIIEDLKIYWMEIPFKDEYGLYPQEIEIETKNGFLLISSIEVNNGEVNTEFTDEILVIDEKENAEVLGLGKFGVENNGRKLMSSIIDIKTKLLFVCSQNKWRSRTAEAIFKNHDEYVVRSAGTSKVAKNKISLELINWADEIYVMEKKHKEIIEKKYGRNEFNISVLNIPDDYQFMDEELIKELKSVIKTKR